MKNLLVLLMSFVILLPSYGSSNVEKEKDRKKKGKVVKVKYKVVEKTYILPQKDLTLESLSLLDKALFKDFEYRNRYVLDLDSEDNLRITTHFIGHKNKFSNWYPHPYKTVEDVNGLTMYNMPSPYRTHDVKREDEEYIAKKLTQLNIAVNRDPFIEEAYKERNKMVKENGLLDGLVFEMPAKDMYQQYDHSVDKNTGVVKVKIEESELIWNPRRKIVVERLYQDGNLIHEKKSVYKYNPRFDEILLKRIVYSDYLKFSNGEDYRKLEIHTYDDYDLIGSETLEKELPMNVIPQTISSYAVVNFPEIKKDASLSIFDVNGRIMMERKLPIGITDYTINLIDYTPGIFFVTLRINEEIFTQKIIKL